jgi:hypothetical protein
MSLQDHVSLKRNQAVDASAWNAATRDCSVWFLALQLCHPAVGVLDEHRSSSETFVARLSAWNEATVRLAAISDVKSWTSQLGVVNELAVHPAVNCARAKTFPTAGARTAASAAANRNRVIVSRDSLLLACPRPNQNTSWNLVF